MRQNAPNRTLNFQKFSGSNTFGPRDGWEERGKERKREG